MFRNIKPDKAQEKEPKDDTTAIPLSSSVDVNIEHLLHLLHQPADLKVHDVVMPLRTGKLVYLETMTDDEKIHTQILAPVSHHSDRPLSETITAREVLHRTDINAAVNDLLNGCAVLFIENLQTAVSVDVKSHFSRSIGEPENEKVIRGSHDGFVESLNININLLRTRLPSKNLVVQFFMIGEEVHTKVAILYMNNIANPDLIQKIDTRLRSIRTDLVMSPGFMEEFIEDSSFSPFPQMLNTERPDRVAYNLMEGRVVLLVNGSPTALILPVTFFAFYQTPDDYNSRWFVGSFYRLLRLVSFIIAITLPALYIAVVAFHFEALPFKLVLPIKESIERIPYPPLFEALIMELTIELIREAGIRLPTFIGPVIGIVGGLVIGQAVVEVHLVSNIMVIIVAITATASFVVSSNEMVTSLRLLRFPVMVSAATFGFMGIILCLTVLLIHLCALESFGTPYFAPWSTGSFSDFKDTFIRLPLWKMDKLPKDSKPKQLKRETDSRRWNADDSENQ